MERMKKKYSDETWVQPLVLFELFFFNNAVLSMEIIFIQLLFPPVNFSQAPVAENLDKKKNSDYNPVFH